MFRCWQSRALAPAAGLALVFGLAGVVGAAHSWLSVRGTGACASSTESLGARILSAVIGTPKPGLRVEVQFGEGAATSARVRLLQGSRSIGRKKLAAPSCEELRDAVVAVVALALSSEPPEARPPLAQREQSVAPPAETRRPLEPAPAAAPRLERSSAALASERPPARGIEDVPARGAAHPLLRDWRLSLGLGADEGTLSESTAVVRAEAAARLPQGELRAVVWYGLPSVRELETDHFERVRADFAALSVDYCLGIDAGRWLSSCAGLEVAVRRYSELSQAAERERIERERLDPGASARLGLAFMYRDASLQPQLDLSAQLPLVGGLAGAPTPGVRATFGAALQF
jgi:hypothetical protein